MQYSVVNYKTVKENPILRMEAEFYSSNILAKDFFTSGSDIIDFVQYGTSKELNEEKIGYPTLRLNEFDSFFIEEPAKYCDKIDENTFENLKLKKGDVLICRTNGNPKLVGKSAIVMKDYPYAYASYLFKIRPKKSKINSATLVSFLNSDKGRSEIEKYSMTSNQTNFSPAKFREINVPIFGRNILDIVDRMFGESFNLLENSKSLYSQAEQLLLFELGLLDWKPKHKLAFVKNFSGAKQSDRFDAEYFQPKYEEIVEAVKKYKGGFEELGNLVKIKDKNFTPKDNEQYKYIELANILSNGEINGYTENFGNELPSRARRKVQKGDLIVSTIEGSLESIALIMEDWKNALCSTGFFAINSDKINSETLLVLLKTKVGQLQLKKGCKGTILTAIGKDELSKIVLPKIVLEIQNQIKEKIIEMYATKSLSKSLLEIAKRGVEMVIEKNEEEAEKWMNNQISELGVSA